MSKDYLVIAIFSTPNYNG